MINFFWIVLIAIVVSAIVMAIVIAGLYLFWDSIHTFILKRKIPKDKSKFKDGGKTIIQNEKEVNQDGQFRDYERLREEGLRSRERAVKDENTGFRSFSDEPRDAKINAIASEHSKPDTRADETW